MINKKCLYSTTQLNPLRKFIQGTAPVATQSVSSPSGNSSKATSFLTQDSHGQIKLRHRGEFNWYTFDLNSITNIFKIPVRMRRHISKRKAPDSILKPIKVRNPRLNPSRIHEMDLEQFFSKSIPHTVRSQRLNPLKTSEADPELFFLDAI